MRPLLAFIALASSLPAATMFFAANYTVSSGATITIGTTQNCTATTTSPQTCSITVAATSHPALLCSAGTASSTLNVSSMTYNGVAFSNGNAALWTKNTGASTAFTQGWILVGPATGTNNLVITWGVPSTNPGAGAVVSCTPFYGVNQTGTVGNSWRTPPTATNDGGSGTASASIAVSSSNGDGVYSACTDFSSSLTISVGTQVALINNYLTSGNNLGVTADVATGALTPTWTLGASNFWACGAVALIPG